MAKVITNKIIMINNNTSSNADHVASVNIDCDTTDNTEPQLELPLAFSASSTQPTQSMHINEELVMVFDEQGNIVGKVEHETIKNMH